MVAFDVIRESSVIEKWLFTKTTPDRNGVDKNVVLHPQVFVKADALSLRREFVRDVAHSAVEGAGRILENVMFSFFGLGEKKGRIGGIRQDEHRLIGNVRGKFDRLKRGRFGKNGRRWCGGGGVGGGDR